MVVISACAHLSAEPPVKMLGDPAPDTAATQTIEIRSDTKWVNVTGGDIVKFVVGGKSFAWAFNVGTGVSRFDLSRVAPPGVLDRPVFVYLAPDPRYIGGGDGDRGLGL
ncbi:CzcE family metal-binding protein [Noviherbaspirillum sp. ST9]|uniref:CzcE family metal-binding protein n=1 Tax=Noviherbaspirillum sp. ST9 TaxID=3401606 RepID=UPI003B58932C